MTRGRVPVSASGLVVLGALAAVPCVPSAAQLVGKLGGDRYWSVLATLRGMMLVRWDEGGRNVRITRAGRDYLRGRR